MTGGRSHLELTHALAEAIAQAAPRPDEPQPCPYLPSRDARLLMLLPRPLVRGVYHALMDLNFRRMGPVFYRPQCEGCRECRMIRVRVAEFQPSRAQRRCLKRNADVSVRVGRPEPTEEKLRLYRHYLEARHDGQMDGSPEEFERFLCASAVDTIEVTYTVSGRIVAVGVADAEPQALSAVYCYFDPDQAARSPGIFNVLWLIEECRRRGVPHLYLGYYVRDCVRMSYKAGYRPCEALDPGGRWVPLV